MRCDRRREAVANNVFLCDFEIFREDEKHTLAFGIMQIEPEEFSMSIYVHLRAMANHASTFVLFPDQIS